LQVWYWQKFYVTIAKHGVDIDYSNREKPLIQFWDEPKVIKSQKVKFGEGGVCKTLFNINNPFKKILSLLP
jgi:hypothetical protein